MSETINDVKRAVKAGDTGRARQLLKPILQNEPSADAWTLAAMVTDSDEQAVKCLKRALAIDEWHSTANRMLSDIQRVTTAAERGYQVDTGFQEELDSVTTEAREKGNFFVNLIRGMRRPSEDDTDADGDAN